MYYRCFNRRRSLHLRSAEKHAVRRHYRVQSSTRSSSAAVAVEKMVQMTTAATTTSVRASLCTLSSLVVPLFWAYKARK